MRALVANRDIARGEIIAEYTGPILSIAEADNIPPDMNHYLLQARRADTPDSPQVVIDGTPTPLNPNIAACANFVIHKHANGAFIDKHAHAPPGKATYVVAKEPCAP